MKAGMGSKGTLFRDLYRQEYSASYRPIPTFVRSLDDVLQGGIKPGLVTEIVGDNGMGKTTLCLQLCLDVQIPQALQGLEAEALLIDTENSVVASRLEEMARAFALHCSCVASSRIKKLTANQLLSRIHLVKPKDLNQLSKIVLSLIDYIQRNRRVRLVVIDSIAFPFYAEDDSFWVRSKTLYSIGQTLHYIAGEFGVAVVLTNNLTTRFDAKGNKYHVPFLGDSWYHVPNQRVQLYWGHGHPRARVAEIVKSPCAPPAEVNYKVTTHGIRE